jgi:hypothetical protein
LEVERVVSNCALISLANKQILAAERLRGMLVGVHIEEQTLLFFDITTRELLRTRPNPITREQALRLRGVRPAGPPPPPSQHPIRIQRRASDTGVVVVAGQKVSLGRTHRGQEVEILVSETTLTIHLADHDVRTIRRTNTQPIRNIKADRRCDRDGGRHRPPRPLAARRLAAAGRRRAARLSAARRTRCPKDVPRRPQSDTRRAGGLG